MKSILLLLSAIIFTAAARANEQLISTFSWKELADSGKLTGAPDNAIEVDNHGVGAMSATVLTIKSKSAPSRRGALNRRNGPANFGLC
jgi:hypothetical protein